VSRNIVGAAPRRPLPRAPLRLVREESDPAESLRRRLDELSPFAIGLEEELLVVDAETFAPVPAAASILAALGEERLATERRTSRLALASPLSPTAREAAASLASRRQDLRGRVDRGLSLIAAGAHPLARDPGAPAGLPRHRPIARDHPVAARMTLTCGLHVHVAVPGPERALAVANALRSYLPLIGAIGVNSPFHAGEDSGMASVRGGLNAALPRTAIPPAFASWNSYAAFLRRGSRRGLASDLTSIARWDARLSPHLGTIEVRIADVQTRAEDSAAIAALVQALAARLAARHDAGEQLPVHPSRYIQENAWLAARDGTGGLLVDLDTGTRRFTADMLAGLIRELGPTAKQLRCRAELDGALRLVLETGADRQRSMADAAGIDGLLYWLATRTVRSDKEWLASSPDPGASARAGLAR
jgi:carboxylate-amine ligase